MTKEDVVQLGIRAQTATELFRAAGYENTKTDPKERAEQTLRYEQLRADMHEAINARDRAAAQL